MTKNTLSIKPLNKFTILKLAPKENKTAGGIILNQEKREQTGVVVAAGKDCAIVKEGDKVMFQLGDFKLIAHDSLPNDGEYAMVLEDHIIGIFEND